MKYNLFSDDERIPQMVTWVNLPNVNWEVVSCYEQFVHTIEKNGLPEIVSFDHDLADEHYVEYTAAHDPKSLTRGRINYDAFKEKTGYDCAKWLAQYCVDNNRPIPQYYIHTMNPIGGANIFSILESAKRVIQV